MQRFIARPFTRLSLNKTNISISDALVKSTTRSKAFHTVSIINIGNSYSFPRQQQQQPEKRVESSTSFPTPYGQHKNTKPMTVNDNLPDPFAESRKVKYQFTAFICLVTVAFLMIVNYEKMSSPMIGSTMHFMRRSPEVKEFLQSKDIDFDSIFPWIKGTLNQVQGKINVSFNVKGVQSGMVGTVKLVADRPNKNVPLTIREWSISSGDEKIDIMSNKELEF